MIGVLRGILAPGKSFRARRFCLTSSARRFALIMLLIIYYNYSEALDLLQKARKRHFLIVRNAGATVLVFWNTSNLKLSAAGLHNATSSVFHQRHPGRVLRSS
jgi:hypothetical protein